jgi:hypothetical protein
MTPGLSFDQAPPFSAPLRFFLTAPLFLLAAALLAAFDPAWAASRWTPSALALTHLFVLGFLAMVMAGALLQVLPVVVGQRVPHAVRVARIGHIGLALGALLLTFGLGAARPAWIFPGAALIGAGLLPLLAALGLALLRARPAQPHTRDAIRLAAIALTITLALGIHLAGGLTGLWAIPDLVRVANLHATWGLIGWVAALVFGVAYQVVPMFQLTPAYPAWLMRALAVSLPLVLLLASASMLAARPWSARLSGAALVLAALTTLAFALTTLDLQRRRRRKLADVTLDFWRIAMASLTTLALALPGLLFEDLAPRIELPLGLLFVLGFGVSAVCGMLYKIVPFLAWFHLQSQTGARAGTIPTMKQLIDQRVARWHVRLHLATLALTMAGLLASSVWLVRLGSLLLAANAVLLCWGLYRATWLFLRHGGRLGPA